MKRISVVDDEQDITTVLKRGLNTTALQSTSLMTRRPRLPASSPATMT